MSSRAQDDSLQCLLDRLVNGRAVLRFSDSQELAVARRFLPKTVSEGDVLHIHLHTEATATIQKEELAKAILREILQS